MDEVRKTVEELDNLIRQQLWFDFQVFSYIGSDLIISGSTDFAYYHQLELCFHNVFFASAYFRNWRSDTTKPVFVIPEQLESYQSNIQLEIEQGCRLFLFKTEDFKNDVIIAAESLSYNTDTVLYYYREDLLPGQRLAPGITKPV